MQSPLAQDFDVNKADEEGEIRNTKKLHSILYEATHGSLRDVKQRKAISLAD
jgi:hypothetical protein